MAGWVCAACTTEYTVDAPACPHCGSTEHEEAGKSMLPMIQVVCRTDGCRAVGRVQAVRLPPAGSNLVQMPALLCALCGRYVETVTPWEGIMPKITRHGGPTNYATRAEVTPLEQEEPESIDGAPPAAEVEPEPPEALEPEPEAQEPDASEASERPATTDRKDVWVAYAITQGADPDEAQAATKKDLIAAYGEREQP